MAFSTRLFHLPGADARSVERIRIHLRQMPRTLDYLDDLGVSHLYLSHHGRGGGRRVDHGATSPIRRHYQCRLLVALTAWRAGYPQRRGREAWA